MRITQGETIERQLVLRIELDDQDTAPYVEIGYRKVRPNVAHPGFRKGKAPRHIIMQRFGREALLNEALDEMLPEITTKAIEAQELTLGGIPSVQIVAGQPELTLEATVPLIPHIELGPYLDIRVQSDAPEITDDDIQKRLETLQASMSSWEPVTRPAQIGDMVTLTGKGIVNGNAVMDETDTVYLMAEDADRPFPGFAEALVGAELNQPQEFDLTIAENFPVQEVAGEPVQVSVTITEAKERVLPELDEDFANSVGEGYDSLDALREQIKSELTAEADAEASESLRAKALQSLIDGAYAEIPPLIIDSEVNRMINQQAQVFAQMNIRLEDYLRSTGSSLAELRDQIRDEAETRVKSSVALGKLGETEDIQVHDGEVEARIQLVNERRAALPQTQTGPPAEPLPLNDETRYDVRQTIRIEKTWERLIAIAKGEAADQPQTQTDEPSDASADAPADAPQNQAADAPDAAPENQAAAPDAASGADGADADAPDAPAQNQAS